MSKKLILIGGLTLASMSFLNAQTTVYAYIKDEQGKPVESAEVDLRESSNDVTADKIGYFQFVDLQPGNYQMVLYKNNYETKVVDFSVSEGEKRKDLGVIILKSILYDNSTDQGFTLLENNDDDGDTSSQTTVGLLQSSRDIFSRIAGYDLGTYYFRARGLDGRSSEMMFNGASMIRPNAGTIDFGSWGGLNDITRYPEVAENFAPSEYAFGGINSVIYKNTRASEYRKGNQLTYSITNRSGYRHRLAYRHSTGLSKSGWAFTGMITRRWAEEGRVEGSFYDSYAGYLGVEKKFSDKHTITFNAIAAPTRRAGGSPLTQEMHDYMGIYYNSYWGWLNGKKRSERVRETIQPILQLTDYWKISKKSELQTTVSYQFGKSKYSRLDRFNMRNITPQYYRNLPSYDIANLDNWLNNNQSVTQVDWLQMYHINQNIGGASAFYLVNDVNDDKIWNVYSHFTHNFSDNTRLFLNVSYQNYKSNQYREVGDLLGGQYVMNTDSYSAGMAGSYDTRSKNEKYKGDRLNYDYTFGRQDVKVNPGVKFSTGKFDVMVSGLFGYSTSYREGHMQHYLYPDSYGKSKNYDFTNYGLKGQVIYKINGRNFLVYNGTTYSQAPYLESIFFNPRSNASVLDGIKNTFVNANDLNYVLATPFVKARLGAYIITKENDINVNRYYADGGVGAFVTEVMENVGTRNVGLEFAADVKITPTLSLQGLVSLGDYFYTNNPDLYLSADTEGFAVGDNAYNYMGKTYIKNYKQGGSAQTALSFGFRYNSPKYWWVGASWNYFDNSYLSPAGLVRTDSFVIDPATGEPFTGLTESELRRVLQPKKLPTAFFLNANAGKSWILGKYYLLISASVNNILDNKKYITGGFEQTRFSNYGSFVADYDKQYPNFAPKYWYNIGRSYFVNVQFRF